MEIEGQSLEASADPNIAANVNEYGRGSNQSLADSFSSGAGRGLLSSRNNFDQDTGFGHSAEMDAIRGRYMPQFDRQEKQLKLDNLKAAGMDRIRNLQVATEAAGQEVQMNKQKTILKDKIEKAQRAARGAVLGHVLGIVGGVVAGYFTAGTGAAAGFAAGEAAGQAIGGS